MTWNPADYGATEVTTGSKPFNPADYGATPVTQTPMQQSKPSVSDSIWGSLAKGTNNVVNQTASNYGSDINAARDKIGSSISGGADTMSKGGLGNVAKGALQASLGTAAGGVQAIFAPLAAPIQTLIHHSNAGTLPVAPEVQKAHQALSDWATQHPEIARTVGDAFTVGTAAMGSGALDATVSDTVNAAKGGLEKGALAVRDATVGTPEARAASQATAQAAKAAQAQEVIRQSAIKDATPVYNPKLISDPFVNGVPRIQGGKGLTGGREVTPTPLNTRAGEALSKVPNYPATGTALDKYNAVQPEIAAQAKALTKSLESENILRPPKEIVKIVNDAVRGVSDESLLLQKADPAIAQYMRVAKNAVATNDGTLAGELKVRQAMDAAYKNARGKLAFGDSKISALDEIHTAARDALNKDMIEKAQNTDVKASLQTQWDLNRGADELLAKAEAEGNSKIEQLMKANPVTTKVLKAGVKATGLGLGLHLLP